jgi:hypothetical protein
MALPGRDWAEIYYALDYKLKHSPALDPGHSIEPSEISAAGVRKWRKHLEKIRDNIAEALQRAGVNY